MTHHVIRPRGAISFHAGREGSLFDRSSWPIIAGQWGNHDSADQSEFESWIKIAHRLFVEVDDATGFERPDIIYFNDGLLSGALNQGIRGPILPAVADTAKPLTQISLDCGCPLNRIIGLSRGGLLAALMASGSIGIVRRCDANDGGAPPDCLRFLIQPHAGPEVDNFVDELERSVVMSRQDLGDSSRCGRQSCITLIACCRDMKVPVVGHCYRRADTRDAPHRGQMAKRQSN